MELDRKSAVVTIKNNSTKNYAFPIELTNLKAYYENDIVCEYFHSYHAPSHGLSFSLKLTDPKTKEILKPQRTHVNIDFESFEKYLTENKGCFSLDEEKEEWQVKHKIKDKTKADLNYYIYNHLIYLRPNQRFSYRIVIDLENISSEFYFIDRYDVKPNTKYAFELYTEITDCIYDLLTPEQKEEIKDYTLFTGKITSNIIDCNSTPE
ncbi:hypothetical protein GCM10023210_35620 [Chryseobacterium ginsengisoli]|uniref:Uncharacterized protein n=1 Tax=Chryseobacterium ginsengisoli TaxID=363853 RepID=A0ABP9MSV5_9FLAO